MRNGNFNSIGEVVKHARKSIHKTQEEFGRLLKIEAKTLSKIENDKSNVTLSTLNKIAHAFGLELTLQLKISK